MTWLPCDHRLGVHHLYATGSVDGGRPMADVEAVRLALQGAYTLVHDPGSGLRGMAPGLEVHPLAWRLTSTIASGNAMSVPRAGFRCGDLTWVQQLPLGSPNPPGSPVALAQAAPEYWLDSNWPAVAAALTSDFALHRVAQCAPDRVARLLAVRPLRRCQEVAHPLLAVHGHWPERQRGDLTWAVALVVDVASKDVDGQHDPKPSELPRRRDRQQDIPWWDLGAWHLNGWIPRP